MANPALRSATQKPHILVVDDDDRLRSLIKRYLLDQSFIVTTAHNARDARQKMINLTFDLLVLDVMMPGENGLELTAALRKSAAEGRQIPPVLLLTARGEPRDRIEGFEQGADDYLSKPFEPRELVLRIQSILRRQIKPKNEDMALKLGSFMYHQERDELIRGDDVVLLTDMEAGLLRILANDPGVPLSREVIAERSKGIVSERTIDVQVTRLRRKIESDAKNPRYLVTVRGEGYMLMPD